MALACCPARRALPLCSLLRSSPASTRAAAESGGVLTSPCSHNSGLSIAAITTKCMSIMTYIQDQEVYCAMQGRSSKSADEVRQCVPERPHRIARIDDGTPLAANELKMRYRMRDQQIKFASMRSSFRKAMLSDTQGSLW